MDWKFLCYDCGFVCVCVFIPVVLIYLCTTQKIPAQNALAVILDCRAFYSSAFWLNKWRRDNACVIIASNLNTLEVTSEEITAFSVRGKITNHHHF